MLEELKPCPFCGGKALIKSGTLWAGVREPIYTAHIMCVECEATSNDFIDLAREDGAHKKARLAWKWRV